MAITIHIYYTGKNQDAKKFAKEMVDSGLVHAIRNEGAICNINIFIP